MPRKKRITTKQKRIRAVSRMLRTKKELLRLKQAQKARDMIDAGATLEDIFKEFNCTSISQALAHVRNAIRLGGRLVSSLIAPIAGSLSGPTIARNLGRGGTRIEAEPAQQESAQLRTILTAIPQLISAQDRRIKQVPSEASKVLKAQFGVDQDDTVFEAVAKIVNKLYGPPEGFRPLGPRT